MESAVRELIMNESERVNERIGWLLQTQALLFAALAFAWDSAPKLSYILAAVGMATALSFGSVLHIGSGAIGNLVKWFEHRVPADQRDNRLVIGRDWIREHTPPARRGRTRVVFGQLGFFRSLLFLAVPWKALPVVFMLAWVGVILTRSLA
jgi:hypothetical protein